MERKRKYVPIRIRRPESTVVAETEENQGMPEIAQPLMELSAQLQEAIQKFQMVRPRIPFQLFTSRIQMLNAMLPAPKEQKEAETVKCPYCGENVPASSKYCPECGFNLKGTTYSRAGSEHLSIEG